MTGMGHVAGFLKRLAKFYFPTDTQGLQIICIKIIHQVIQSINKCSEERKITRFMIRTLRIEITPPALVSCFAWASHLALLRFTFSHHQNGVELAV